MITTEMRLDVRLISTTAFRQYLAYRQLTYRELAARVGCSHSTIGHLCTGKRKTCGTKIALQIEKALDAPRGSLFVASISPVTRETGRSAA